MWPERKGSISSEFSNDTPPGVGNWLDDGQECPSYDEGAPTVDPGRQLLIETAG